MKSKNKGFSLIEIMVVMVILGLMLGLVAVNMDSISPSSRLDASARSIYSTLSLALSHAVMTGKPTKIAYNLSENYCELYISGEKKEFESFDKKYLPKGVTFKDVDIAGDRKHTSGWVEVTISPLGILAGHVIHLSNERNEETTVEVNPLSGVITIKDGYYKMDFVEKL